MRIRVRADGHTIFIPIPSCLIFNSLGAYMLYRFAAPHISWAEGMEYRQLRFLMRGLNSARHRLHGQPLVEVESSNGERVIIYL